MIEEIKFRDCRLLRSYSEVKAIPISTGYEFKDVPPVGLQAGRLELDNVDAIKEYLFFD